MKKGARQVRTVFDREASPLSLEIYKVVPMICQPVTEKRTNGEEMEKDEEEQKETTSDEEERIDHVTGKGKGKEKGPLREAWKGRAGGRGVATDRKWEAK